MVAGEASADLHGSNLVKAMKRMDPDIIFWGIGGDRMRQAGVRLVFTSSEIAVVGLTEVLKRLSNIFRASIRLKSILENHPPDLLILIDYPEFNLHIAKTARRHGVPVLYYISPQVWAWRRWRVKKISRRVDKMSVILPFEEAFYRKRGVEVSYVGHPILDACSAEVDRQETRARLGIQADHLLIGIVPGSRKEEIKQLLPVMIQSARMLAERDNHMLFLLPLAPTLERSFVQSFIDRDMSDKIRVVNEDVYHVLSLCRAAMVTSGTATLEAALAGVPMVIVYRVSSLSYWVGRMLIKVPYIGLVNLVAGQRVVPELIQADAKPERLTAELVTILKDGKVRTRTEEGLKQVRETLGRGGASIRTAKIALQMMEEGPRFPRGCLVGQ